MFESRAVDAMPPGPQLAAVLLSADPAALDEEKALCWLRAAERLAAHLEAGRYDVLARYADLSAPTQPSDRPASAGVEREVSPGGAGTPGVAEFAVTDLAVALRCTTGRAGHLIGDALDLRHRMPALSGRLRAGEVPGFKVRMVLRAAAGLSETAARRLDAEIAPVADKIGPARLEDEISRVLLEVEPGEAERRARAAADRRRVSVVRDADGDRRIHAQVDAFDGMAFDAAVDHVAEILADLGDTRVKDARRAAAVGWLANPVAVLALAQRHSSWARGEQPMPWPTTSITTLTDAEGQQHLTPGLWPLDVPTPHDLVDPGLWPRTSLVVHLDQRTWQSSTATGSGAGVADLAGHGPVTVAQAFDRLRHSQVTITPVVDLDDELQWVADGDVFTGRLRRAAQLAHRWNPFPYADAETRADDDLDHTRPHARGGPTTLGNAAPLRRRLHRHKTFAQGWRVRQPFPGILLWRSREGRIYLCDRRGHTHDLGYGDAT